MNGPIQKPIYSSLINLASEKLGARVLEANDDFFAEKENLIRTSEAVFKPDLFTDRGKWMDGWETRRRRTPGHDWCIVQLAVPGTIEGVDVDTSYFLGNHPPEISLDGAVVANKPDTKGSDVNSAPIVWNELLPRSPIAENTHNYLEVPDDQIHTHVRLNIYPDGGVARLRVFGTAVPAWLPDPDQDIELSAVRFGGRVLDCSDEHFGAVNNLLSPGQPENMGDGWETRRRRGPGHDWVLLKLGAPGTLSRVEIDTAFFIGNFPERVSVEGCNGLDETNPDTAEWRTILPESKLQANNEHQFDTLESSGPFSHVRVNIFPDGGISRLRIFGIRANVDG